MNLKITITSPPRGGKLSLAHAIAKLLMEHSGVDCRLTGAGADERLDEREWGNTLLDIARASHVEAMEIELVQTSREDGNRAAGLFRIFGEVQP